MSDRKKKFAGAMMSGIGGIISIMSLGIFSLYALWSLPGIELFRKLLHNLFFKSLPLPTIMIPIIGVVMLTLGLLFILIGLSFSLAIVVPIGAIVMLVFGLVSILFGLPGLSFSYSSSHFNLMDICLILIFVSGLLYIVSSIFLFQLKKPAKELSLIPSIILMVCLTPVALSGMFDPWGWGKLLAFSLLPYIIFPLFFIIFLTRPKIKELFKR